MIPGLRTIFRRGLAPRVPVRQTATMHWRIEQLVEWGQDLIRDRLLALRTPRPPLPEAVARLRVLLLGASVGKAWRLHVVYPNLRALAHYAFDKGPILEGAIASRPDAIIIKECAAYFPDDGVDRSLLPGWLRRIRTAGIRPVLATVVPVTRAHAARAPGRVEAIWAFNDWLRGLAAEEKVPLLELEAALRCSPEDRHLDERFDSGDGLHLCGVAYRARLDPLIPPMLERIVS